MKRNILIAIIILALVIGGYLIYTTQKQKDSESFKVGIATWPGFAPGYVANSKGFFGDLKVEFFIIDDFTARQTSFVSNKTQATIGTIDSYAFDQGNGVDGKLIMILDQSNGADGIIVKTDINSISELKGKKVAYTRGSPSHFFLIKLLKKNSLNIADIQALEVDDPGKAGEAFISGSVDAAVTWEPNISEIVSSGRGKLLESSKSSPGFIVDEMEISVDAYSNRKEDIQKFVEGWLKAVDYIKTNQKEAYSIMAKNLNIPENDFPSMASGLIYADKKMNQEWLLPNDNSKAKQLYDEAKSIWNDLKLIKKPKSESNLITSEFISQ